MSTEKKMLRKTSRLKTEQATGGWIKLLRKQLHRLHCSPNNDQIMEDEMDGTSGIHGGGGLIQTSGGKPFKKENTWKN